MWTCGECGCQQIAGDLVSCPVCGKEKSVAKISVSAGATYAPGLEPEGVVAASGGVEATVAVPAPVAEAPAEAPAPSAPTAPVVPEVSDDAPVDVNGDGQLDRYETATRADLVGEASRRGLSAAGSKADLVRRLQDADKATAAAAASAQQAGPASVDGK